MNEKKFNIICEQYYNEILCFIKRKIGFKNYQNVYDVTNKTFLQLIKRKKLILELGDLEVKKFIYSTASNCCMQYFQENTKRNQETELSDNINIPVETEADKNIKAILEIIQDNLTKFTEVEQKLFREHWMKERKLYEIAEELHISYENIRQINSRLRYKIAALVQEELHT